MARGLSTLFLLSVATVTLLLFGCLSSAPTLRVVSQNTSLQPNDSSQQNVSIQQNDSSQQNVSSQGETNVTIFGFAFNPSTIEIEKGTSVVWANKDSTSHTVTADSGVFYSGTIASGDTWSKTFNETGTYEYHCNFHPSMKAKIVVTEKTG